MFNKNYKSLIEENKKLKEQLDEIKKNIHNDIKYNIKKRKKYLEELDKTLDFIDELSMYLKNRNYKFSIFGGFIRDIITCKSSINIDYHINSLENSLNDIDMYFFFENSRRRSFKNTIIKLFQYSIFEIQHIESKFIVFDSNHLCHVKLILKSIKTNKILKFDLFNKIINFCNDKVDYSLNNFELVFDSITTTDNLTLRNYNSHAFGNINNRKFQNNNVNLLNTLGHASVGITETNFPIHNKINSIGDALSLKKLCLREKKMEKKKYYFENKFIKIDTNDNHCNLCLIEFSNVDELPKYCSQKLCKKKICADCFDKMVKNKLECAFCRSPLEFNLNISEKKINKIIHLQKKNIKNTSINECRTVTHCILSNDPFSMY